MNFKLRGASGVALLVGLSGGFQTAAAQQTPAAPANPNQTVRTAQQPAQPSGPQAAPPAQTDQNAPAPQGEKVVVTGSLIATAAEDAPKPVEVYNAEALKAQGSPTVSEFVRSLTTSFGADLGFGQASQDIPTGAGFANADLRGVGPNGTLVLMNGRRLASSNGGFGADLNTIPNEALEAVEVLKDGASTTYGAGAVGGVLNFRTRRDIDAPTFTFERTLYDGSDGEYNIDAQNGWVGDAGNVLMSFHYGHVDYMLQTARDFSSLPYAVNPSPYSLNAPNPGRFIPSTMNFLTPPSFAAFSTAQLNAQAGAGVNDLPGNVGAAATAACQAIGGDTVTNLNQAPITTGSNTACAIKQFYFQDLVNENDSYRFYGEVNTDITDSMEFHFDATYSKGDTKRNDIPTAAPTNRVIQDGFAPLSGAVTGCSGSCQFVIPVQVNTYSSPNPQTIGAATAQVTRNPFIDDFMTRTGVTAAQLPATGALYTAANWRPFGYGGNQYFDNGLRQGHQVRERLLLTTGFNGEFTGDTFLGSLLEGIKYDYAAQYNHYLDTTIAPDVIVSRLQNALLGYGGANCSAFDIVPTIATEVLRSSFVAGATGDLAFNRAVAQAAADYNRTVGIQSNTRPGTNGCEWFNPFASAWPKSVANGANNPMYNAGNPVLVAGSSARPSGYGNSFALADWLQMDRVFENQYQSGTFDATWSGQLPEAIRLPGGAIGWAAGSQWRMTERRNISSAGQTTTERNLNMQECPFPDPDVVNLPAQAEPGVGRQGCAGGLGAFFGADEHTESDTSSQTIAYYAEVSLPVLDNLNFSASARREVYNGGDIQGDIWSVAGKYDITDNLFVRASYGTNFRAEAALDAIPGLTTRDVTLPTRFGSNFPIDEFTITAPNLSPEDDTTLNIGIGYNTEIGEGRLRLGLDFFEITIDGEVTTTSATTVYTNVFGADSVNAATVNSQTNRTNPLIPDGQPGSVPGTVGVNGSTLQYADCQARLVFLVLFNSPCVTGTTTAANMVASLRSNQNGPSRVMNGIDYSLDFSYPLLDGTFGVNLTATQNLVWKTQGYNVSGLVFETPQDRLGYVNNGSLTVPAVSELRGNATLRWANDQHSFNLRANYMKGVQDERNPDFDPTDTIYPTSGTVTDVDGRTGAGQTQFSTYGTTPKDYLDFDFTYLWTAPFWEELEFRASVLNLTDRNPLGSQNRNGYLSGIGNPRGRQIEFGVTKRF